jgi:hypothetical protein
MNKKIGFSVSHAERNGDRGHREMKCRCYGGD